MMKIGKKFNELPFEEYFRYIKDHKQYSDFNTLGLYRSIVENEQLSLEEKIELREFAHEYFQKTFDFLQLKDPFTFFKVSTLGEELTRGDELQLWKEIREGQEKILKEKRIKHRNFGTYSKHECGDENCPMNGLMIRREQAMAEERDMWFAHDKDRFKQKEKSKKRKKDRKNQQQLIRKDLEA